METDDRYNNLFIDFTDSDSDSDSDSDNDDDAPRCASPTATPLSQAPLPAPRGPFPYGWDHTELIRQDRHRRCVPEAAAALLDLLTNYDRCTSRDIFKDKVELISEVFSSVKKIVKDYKFPQEKNFMPADEFISFVTQYKNNVYSIATLFAEPMPRPPPSPVIVDPNAIVIDDDSDNESVEAEFKSPYKPKIMFEYQDDGKLSFVDAIQSPYAVFNPKADKAEPPSIEVLRQMTDADSDLMRGKNFVFHSAVVQWAKKEKESMGSSAGHFAAVLRDTDEGLWLVDNEPVQAIRINDIGDIRGNGFNYVTFAIFANKNVRTEPYDPKNYGIDNFGNTCWFAASSMALTGLPLFERVLKDLANSKKVEIDSSDDDDDDDKVVKENVIIDLTGIDDSSDDDDLTATIRVGTQKINRSKRQKVSTNFWFFDDEKLKDEEDNIVIIQAAEKEKNKEEVAKVLAFFDTEEIAPLLADNTDIAFSKLAKDDSQDEDHIMAIIGYTISPVGDKKIMTIQAMKETEGLKEARRLLNHLVKKDEKICCVFGTDPALLDMGFISQEGSTRMYCRQIR